MNFGKFLRIALLLVIACVILWASNGLFYLFNHPTHRGEAALAVIGLILLATLFIWLIVEAVHRFVPHKH